MESRHDVLYRLWAYYLHMRAWGLPEYERLDADDREAFKAVLKSGQLFARVEDAKRDVLRAGIEVSDEVLHPLIAAHFSSEGLSQADRNTLGGALGAIYPILCRLEVESEAPRPNQWTEFKTMSEWADVFGFQDVRTFKSVVEAGKIRIDRQGNNARVHADDLPAGYRR